MKLDRHPQRSEVGASSVEYGVLVSLVASVIVTAVLAFGGVVGDLYTDSCQDVLTSGVATSASTGC